VSANRYKYKDKDKDKGKHKDKDTSANAVEQYKQAQAKDIMKASSIKQILGAVNAYANANGMTARDVLAEVRGHDDFPKGKRGRPRKDEVSSPEPESKRPRGRPPVGAVWDEAQECYVNTDDGEVYQKVVRVPTCRPRGRPRTSEPKMPSTRPKGRPPKGKVWSEEDGVYVDEE